MADNLRFDNGDVQNFYIVTYGLERTLEVTFKDTPWLVEKDKPKFPFNDPELVDHLDAMKDILANKFETFCKNCVHGRSYISRSKAAVLRKEFYKRERQELNRIKKYQESRPDLYD